MKLSIPSGTTSKRVGIFIQDSSSTTGAGLTGLVFNSGSLVCYSWIDTDGNAGGTAQALQTATLGTWTTRGFKEKDASNMPGMYEFGIPDALLAAGVKWAIIMFKGATNMAPLVLEIEVTAVNNQSATAFITGVNSLAPPASWNTDIVQTGDAFVRLGAPAGASTAADIAATKALLPTALAADGSIKASIMGFLGTAFTEGAVGRFAANFKTFFNVGSATGTQDVIPTTTNVTNAPTAGDLTATMKASVTTAATAATPTAAAVTAPVTAGTVSDKTGYALTAAYDAAKSASQAGDAMALTAGERTTLKAKILEIFGTDTHAEPAQGAPAATTTWGTKIDFLYKFLRNKKTQTATTFSVFNDDAVTVDHKATTSDDATTATVGEIASGP